MYKTAIVNLAFQFEGAEMWRSNFTKTTEVNYIPSTLQMFYFQWALPYTEFYNPAWPWALFRSMSRNITLFTMSLLFSLSHEANKVLNNKIQAVSLF